MNPENAWIMRKSERTGGSPPQLLLTYVPLACEWPIRLVLLTETIGPQGASRQAKIGAGMIAGVRV